MLFRSLNGSAASSSHQNTIFENLNSDRKLWLRVASCNGPAFDLSPDFATIEVTLPNFELAPPSNLRVTATGSAGVKLAWTATTNSTKQYILQFKLNDGAWTNPGIYWSPGTNATGGTYPDTTSLPSLQLNSSYAFRIKTCISSTGADLGKSSEWIYSETVRTPAQCELPAPTNLVRTGSSPDFTLAWNAVPGATSYYVSGYLFDSGGGTYPTTTTTTNSYPFSSTRAGARFDVSAINKATLSRSEPAKYFNAGVTTTAITLTASFKTATSIGLRVDHQTWLNYNTNIKVDYKKSTDTEWIPAQRFSSSASTSPIWFGDLEPSTTYNFRAYHVGMEGAVPATTTLSVTTAASEFAFGYWSVGTTTGFIAALVSAETVKFYHSTTGTGFTVKSQIAIQKPCFHFDEAKNLTIVGGKGVLFTSKDSVNWRKTVVCGHVRNIQYDHATQKYLLFNENGHLLTATESELENAALLGPFVATSVDDYPVKYMVHDTAENAFALTTTKSYCKF